jgi:16S rRNA (guanine966-N2)-methyltransferase
VRESVFAALEARGAVAGARVIDLYAGSGVLAIEALSRGADRAVLVERDRSAAELCRSNLEALGFADRARVVTGDVAAFLGGSCPPDDRADLVFFDPPYALPDAVVEELLRRAARAWLAPDATVVAHRRRHAPAPPPGWRVAWERSFGDTLIALVEAHS